MITGAILSAEADEEVPKFPGVLLRAAAGRLAAVARGAFGK
jgi:hypothetical protein